MTKTMTIEEWLTEAYAEDESCPPPEVFLQAEWTELDDAARDRAYHHLESCPACAAERDLAAAYDAETLPSPRTTPDLEAILAATRSQDLQPGGGAVLRFRLLSRLAPRNVLAVAAAAVMVFATAMVLRTRGGAPTLPPPPVDDIARGSRVVLVAPLGEIEALPSSLLWQPVESASSYRVTLTAVDETVLWTAATEEPPLVLPPDLRAGLADRVLYFWRVEALDDDGDRLAWSESARFRSLADSANPSPSEGLQP